MQYAYAQHLGTGARPTPDMLEGERSPKPTSSADNPWGMVISGDQPWVSARVMEDPGHEGGESVSNNKVGGDLLTSAVLEALKNCFSNVFSLCFTSLSAAAEEVPILDLLQVLLVVVLPTLALDLAGFGCGMEEFSGLVLLPKMEWSTIATDCKPVTKWPPSLKWQQSKVHCSGPAKTGRRLLLAAGKQTTLCRIWCARGASRSRKALAEVSSHYGCPVATPDAQWRESGELPLQAPKPTVTLCCHVNKMVRMPSCSLSTGR